MWWVVIVKSDHNKLRVNIPVSIPEVRHLIRSKVRSNLAPRSRGSLLERGMRRMRDLFDWQILWVNLVF